MTDLRTDNAAVLPASLRFAERLAAHLADVKNTDTLSRIIRSEADQKVEALTRMVFEMHATVGGLAERLPTDLLRRVEAGALVELKPYADQAVKEIAQSVYTEAKLTALLGVIAPKADDCEVCGDPECPA
jgi:hypothetical protein